MKNKEEGRTPLLVLHGLAAGYRPMRANPPAGAPPSPWGRVLRHGARYRGQKRYRQRPWVVVYTLLVLNNVQPNETRHNRTQHNRTPHNETQPNKTTHNRTQHNKTQHRTTSLLHTTSGRLVTRRAGVWGLLSTMKTPNEPRRYDQQMKLSL